MPAYLKGTFRGVYRELWAMDEHRIGLHPIIRRMWALPGQKPIVPVQTRYKWLYVYGFVRPTTGDTFWLLLPCVSTQAFGIALKHFAHFTKINSHRQIRLIIDQAGFHKGKALTIPTGISLYFLPPYSPELQPAERLWALVDRPLVNQHFETLDALQTVVGEQCNWLQDNPSIVKGRTNFHWWPQAG